jgi:hypothetical protein
MAIFKAKISFLRDRYEPSLAEKIPSPWHLSHGSLTLKDVNIFVLKPGIFLVPWS